MVHRKARVRIINDYQFPLLGAVVFHKYSDDYKHEHDFGIVAPHTSTSASMEVDYNTGFGTTGVDWWFIGWMTDEGRTLVYSSPNNFRIAFDLTERLASDWVDKANEWAGKMPSLAKDKDTMNKVFTDFTKRLTHKIFNTEGTAGFKQHMLTSDDANEITDIIINADRTITFKSKSGISDTVTADKSMR